MRNYARCCARKSATHVPRPVALWVVRRGEKCDGSLKGRSYDVHGWLEFKVRTAVLRLHHNLGGC